MEEENDKEDSSTQLKFAINNLLWMKLPGTITLDQAETIALEMHDMVSNPESFLDRQKKAALMD